MQDCGVDTWLCGQLPPATLQQRWDGAHCWLQHVWHGLHAAACCVDWLRQAWPQLLPAPPLRTFVFWASMLQLPSAAQELQDVEAGRVFGASLDLKAVGQPLGPDTLVPGVAVYRWACLLHFWRALECWKARPFAVLLRWGSRGKESLACLLTCRHSLHTRRHSRHAESLGRMDPRPGPSWLSPTAT